MTARNGSHSRLLVTGDEASFTQNNMNSFSSLKEPTSISDNKKIDNSQSFGLDQLTSQADTFMNASSAGPLNGFQPTPFTVIVGRSRLARQHPGNINLRVLAQKYLADYSKATEKRHKSEVVNRIIQQIRQSPGGMFVRQDKEDKNQWHVVDDSVIREKIGYVFRDLLSDKYKSSSKSKAAKRQHELFGKPSSSSSPSSSSTATIVSPSQEPQGVKRSHSSHHRKLSERRMAEFQRRNLRKAAKELAIFTLSCNDGIQNTTKNSSDSISGGSSSSSSSSSSSRSGSSDSGDEQYDDEMEPIPLIANELQRSVSAPLPSRDHNGLMTTLFSLDNNQQAEVEVKDVMNGPEGENQSCRRRRQYRASMTDLDECIPSSYFATTTTLQPLEPSSDHANLSLDVDELLGLLESPLFS